MTTDIQRIINALEYQYDGTDDYESHQKNMALAAQLRELEVSFKKSSTVASQLTEESHREFVLVGRDWYERFSKFHDECQFSELSWEQKTVRMQGYENGWNDAQRFLRQTYASAGPSVPKYVKTALPVKTTFSSLDH